MKKYEFISELKNFTIRVCADCYCFTFEYQDASIGGYAQ